MAEQNAERLARIKKLAGSPFGPMALSRDDVIWMIETIEAGFAEIATTVAAAAQTVAVPSNLHGVDAAYFHGKLSIVIRDLANFKTDELARTLARLARTADDAVLNESEFKQTVAVPDERKAAEHAYVISAFDYAEAPVGSRDWTLFWSGWQKRSALSSPATPAKVSANSDGALNILSYMVAEAEEHDDFDEEILRVAKSLLAEHAQPAKVEDDVVRLPAGSKVTRTFFYDDRLKNKLPRIVIDLPACADDDDAEWEERDRIAAMLSAAQAKDGKP